MEKTKIQAKHIPVELMLDFIDLYLKIPRLTAKYWVVQPGPPPFRNPLLAKDRGSIFLDDFVGAWKNIPPKVIKEKLRNMEEKNLVFSGSFENYSLTPEGEELLRNYRVERDQSLLCDEDQLARLIAKNG
jgi:hypothetical protein